MKKIFLLGGTGFVGTQVCKQLVMQDYRVTVPSRGRADARPMPASSQVTQLTLDVHVEAALTKALMGHDAVVNLVAILHGDRAAFEQVHVALPQKLARACVTAGVRKLVHISAIGANAQQPQSAPSMYLRSKGQGEAALIQAANASKPPAFELTILRPSIIFGAGDKFLNVFAKLQQVLPFMPLACAEARFQPVWVGDVASAVLHCLARTSVSANSAPSIIELCGPAIFTLRELVQLAARLSGVRDGRGRPVIALPLWLARLQVALMSLAPGEPVMTRDNLDSMTVDNIASGTGATLQTLGITPAALEPIAADYLRRK